MRETTERGHIEDDVAGKGGGVTGGAGAVKRSVEIPGAACPRHIRFAGGLVSGNSIDPVALRSALAADLVFSEGVAGPPLVAHQHTV